MMDGAIEVHSEAGIGSKFRFHIRGQFLAN